jgi:hypothetical protein
VLGGTTTNHVTVPRAASCTGPALALALTLARCRTHVALVVARDAQLDVLAMLVLMASTRDAQLLANSRPCD